MTSMFFFSFQGGMCWVKLNVFYLEESLKDLAHKFGNISSNRKDISIFVQMLQELRLNLEPVVSAFLFFVGGGGFNTSIMLVVSTS